MPLLPLKTLDSDYHDDPRFLISFCEDCEILNPNLGWNVLDLRSDCQGDLLSFCIIYDWLLVRFRIAHLAQDSRFACICLADDEDTKLRTLGADFFCMQGSLPQRKGIAKQLSFLVCRRHSKRGWGMYGEYED